MISGAMRTASATRDYYKNHKERITQKEEGNRKSENRGETSKTDNRLEERKEGSSSRENEGEQNGKNHYFKGARAEWQGKPARERFPSGQFKYEDFVRVIDENDKFRTVELKFTVSKDIAAVKNTPEFKKVFKQSIGRVVEQIQADSKIKFKKLKSTKKSGIRVHKNKTGEVIVKVESHNIAKKNISAVKKILENDKYQSLFRDEMVKGFEKIGIQTEAVHFNLNHFAQECTVAWDCVCQAPKSVSLTMMYPEHFEKILGCHEKATTEAMKFVEENYMVTRVRTEGISRRVVTHNMLSAKFTEFYNRDLQPHMHSHNVIFNTTRNPFYIKGRRNSKEYLSVLFKAIYDNYMIIDGVYKSRLGEELKKAGYELNHDKDNRLNFEIAGFSREQLLHFSRVPSIDKKLENMGTNREQSNAKQRNAANLMTRKEKIHVDIDSWKDRVLREMTEMGIQSPKFLHEREALPTLDVSAADLKKTLRDAAADFFYSHAAFTKRQFINGVLERAGDVLSSQYIENYFDRSGRFINLGERHGKTYFSTQENITVEYGIYRYIENGRNKREGIIAEAKLNKALKYSILDDDQDKAVRFMATCCDRVIGIQGDPGVGKSFMLDKSRQIFTKDNYKVIGLAPSNQAALTLKDKSGLQASTLHSFFIRLQKESGAWKEDRNPLDLRQTDFSKLTPGHKEVWFVDEASLIDNYCMNRLLDAAERKNAMVVLTGDRGQLPPVESGRPFHHMINGGKVSYVEVKNMKRQKVSWQVFNAGRLSRGQKNRVESMARAEKAVVTFFDAPPFDYIPAEQIEKLTVKRGVEIEVFKDRSVKEAVQQIVNGNVLEGLRLLSERTREIKNEEVRFKAIADFYVGLSAKERAVTTIVTSVNRDREKINEYIRQRLKEKGELIGGRVFAVTGSRGKVQVKEFAQGDKIIFLRKAYLSGHRIMKNDTATILKIEDKVKWGGKGYGFLQRRDYKRIAVDLKGKRIIFYSDTYDHIDHIFCTTTYKVQSASDKRIIANFDTKQFNVNSANDLLVKTSRSEAEVLFFTNDAKSLYDAVKREYEKVGIADFTEKNFKVHQQKAKPGKAELIDLISRQFEYENAAFSKGSFSKGTTDIYAGMLSRGETNIEISETNFKKFFDEKRGKGDYIEVGELKKIAYYSTEQNIKIENQIYERVAAAKNRGSGFAEAKVESYLRNSTLNDSQQKAIRLIAASKDRVRAVQYSPWVGKEFILNAAGNFYQSEGYKVIALGPSNKVAANLKNRAGFENVFTLHSFLIQLQKEAGTWEADRDPLNLRLADLDGLSPGSHREIWFVDAASLLDNNAMDKLLEAAERKNAEVVPFGDKNQLQPVGAGRPFTNMIENGKIGFVTVDEVLQRKEAWQVFNCGNLSAGNKALVAEKAQQENAVVTFFNRSPFASIDADGLEELPVAPGARVTLYRDKSMVRDAIQHMVDDDLPGSLRVLDNRVHETKDDEVRMQQIAGFYTDLSPAEREQTAIITGTNRDRVKINECVRENLKASDELGPGYVFRVADNRENEYDREFATGDRIIFLKKNEFPGHQVLKDDTGIIQKIEITIEDEKEQGLITIETKGKPIKIDPTEYNYIDHAYCSTTYKELSSTHQRIVANIDTKQYSVNSRNDLLSKLSGSEGEVFIYTNDRKGLYDSVKGAQEKVSIHDFYDKNASGGSEPFCKKVPTPPKIFDNKQLLINKISGKVEYRNAAFSKGDFATTSFDIYSELRSTGKFDPEIELTIPDINKHFDENVRNGHFIEMGDLDGITYFSTGNNIKIENDIYKKVAAAKNRVSGFSRGQVRLYLEHTTLTTGQKEALLFMTTCKDRVKAIQGAPGVGKSFMLNVAKNFYEEQGCKVVALAPSNKAVQNLKDRAGFEDASTIHSYLIKLQKEAGNWETGRDPLDLGHSNLEGLTPGLHKEIWIVDEASLIDNNTMNRLQEAAELKNAELPLIGDMNQLQPVGAGRPYTNMLKDNMIDYVEVNEILRQKEEWRIYHSGRLSASDKDDLVEQAKSIRNNAAVTFFKGAPPEDSIEKQQNLSTYRVESFKTASGAEIEIHKDSSLKDAVKDAVNHNIAASLNKLGTRIREIEDNAVRFQTTAEGYAKLPAGERNDTVIITATNKDRTAINDFVRGNLKVKGDLGKGYDFKVTDILGKKHIREFAPGDKVIFLKKDVINEHFISKDDVGEIKKIEGSKITVTTRKKDVVIPADKYDYIDHAYCRTTYRVQGADYNRVVAHINTHQKLMNSRNDFLVKISRSRHELEIVTNDRFALYDAVKNEQFKISIRDFKYHTQIKNEERFIHRQLEKLTPARFENSQLHRKITADLQKGDANYIKYLEFKTQANDVAKTIHAHKGKSPEKDVLNHLEIEKKALGFKEKSEIYYKASLDRYSSYLSKHAEAVNSRVTPGKGNVLNELSKHDRDKSMQSFFNDYIPFARHGLDMEAFISGNPPAVEIVPDSFGESLNSDFFIEPGTPGIGVDPDSPGIDIPGEDGGIDGPGISFDM